MPKLFGACWLRDWKSCVGHQPVIAPIIKNVAQIAAGIAQTKLSAQVLSEKAARITDITARKMRSSLVVAHWVACSHSGICTFCLFLFLFGNLFANVVHVEVLNGLNQFTELVVV